LLYEAVLCIKKGSDMSTVPSIPYPELPWVLEELVAGVQAELADNLVGVYLVGSLATGDFDLDSDVDFLVVTRHELADAQIPPLQAMHTRLHNLGCYPAEHLEGSYMSVESLNRPDLVGVQPLWYLDNGSITFERSVHDNQWHVRWILRERGITLAGPAPSTFVDHVPVAAIRSETLATLRIVVTAFADALDQPLTFFNSRFGQAFAVLTCCRLLHTITTGIVQSKLAGMLWAMQALDPAWNGLLQQAWEEREGVRFCLKIQQHADTEWLQESLRFLHYGLAEGEQRFESAPPKLGGAL
jgi:hypothetical protein